MELRGCNWCGAIFFRGVFSSLFTRHNSMLTHELHFRYLCHVFLLPAHNCNTAIRKSMAL